MTKALQERIALEVQDEITRLLDEQRDADKAATRLQDECDVLERKDDLLALEVKHAQMMRLIHRGTDISEKIKVLRTPAEIERRVQDRLVRQSTTRRLNNMAAEKNPTTTKKATAKDNGVPAQYLAENGNFKVGMDARLKSDLILAILELPTPKALVQFSKTDAETLFAKFPHWLPFLERKQAILAEATANAEKKAAEKADKEKAKADAKVAKAAEKKAAKASEATITEEQVAALDAEHHAEVAQKSDGDFKPDPKPVSKRSSGRKVRS